MSEPIDAAALDQIFRQAHTVNAFAPRPVPEALLHQIHALASLGPTAMNSQPARFVFVQSPEAKARLKPALVAGNVDKTMAAPVTVIVAKDTRFYEHMPTVWHKEGMREWLAGAPAIAGHFAEQSGTLGGAYFIIAARALGLDCGPMAGFDNAKLDAAFFPDGRYKSNFLINLGYGDPASALPRNLRLTFEQACQIL